MYKKLGVMVALVLLPLTAIAGVFPDAHEKPPAGWKGQVFRLSQDYPAKRPAPETYPWKQFDFQTQPEQYIMALYKYALEGNVETEWRGYDNAVRKWYHTPWMHYGKNGREFIRGLTRERNSRPKELAPTQPCYWQNWAIGMYNPPGGYVTGQVWGNPEKPDAGKTDFPDGTVSVKLLFTAAPVSQVPYLANDYVWQANIDPVGAGNCNERDPSGNRTPANVSLLQIDLAVRDTRADGFTGWVMGTMVYDGNAPGATPWDRMIPIGLQWGNDPLLTPEKYAAGERVKESWINPNLKIPQHLGWNGRLNGPVDNPQAACLSCHGTAQDPAYKDMVAPPGTSDAERMRWFRNVKWNEPFDADDPRKPRTLGYSLQLAMGIENLLLATGQIVADTVNGVVVMRLKNGEEISPVTRDEGVSESELIAMGSAASGQRPAPAAAAPAQAATAVTPWLPYGVAGLIGLIVGIAGTMVVMRSRGGPG